MDNTNPLSHCYFQPLVYTHIHGLHSLLLTSLASTKRSKPTFPTQWQGMGILLKLASGHHNRLIYSKVEQPHNLLYWATFISPVPASCIVTKSTAPVTKASSSPFRFFSSSASPSFNSCLFHVQLFIRQSGRPAQRVYYRPDVRGTFVRFLAQTRNYLFSTRAHQLLHKARELGLFFLGWSGRGVKLIA